MKKATAQFARWLGLLFSAELINRGIIVFFTRIEHDIIKIGMVDSIGHFLRFEAERCLHTCRATSLERCFNLPHKVTRVELYCGLIGINLHQASAVWLVCFNAQNRCFTLTACKAKSFTEYITKPVACQALFIYFFKNSRLL